MDFMSSRSSKFLIGLFVITGVMICVVIIIWVGAADLFMKGSTYVTYFDESVQGLQADSAVKYRGVEIGKVESIKVAPDYRLIEVAMKIDLSADLQYNTTAQLRTAGITGIVFIELDRLKQGDRASSPTITFKTDYPVIPSRPSEISRFLSDTNAIMQNFKEMDFKGISNQLKNTTKAIETFLGGNHTSNIMANMESTSANLDKSVENFRVTSENLSKLSEQLNNNPSELFFDRPIPPKKNME
jgi:phospholipid/cholesterol/gamma-HCH transport system substrate-binding protein